MPQVGKGCIHSHHFLTFRKTEPPSPHPLKWSKGLLNFWRWLIINPRVNSQRVGVSSEGDWWLYLEGRDSDLSELTLPKGQLIKDLFIFFSTLGRQQDRANLSSVTLTSPAPPPLGLHHTRLTCISPLSFLDSIPAKESPKSSFIHCKNKEALGTRKLIGYIISRKAASLSNGVPQQGCHQTLGLYLMVSRLFLIPGPFREEIAHVY